MQVTRSIKCLKESLEKDDDGNVQQWILLSIYHGLDIKIIRYLIVSMEAASGVAVPILWPRDVRRVIMSLFAR